MKFFYPSILILTCIVLFAFTSNSNDDVKFKPINPSNFDNNVKPTDDFYQYVNGTWLKNNPIPPSESRWSSFNEIRERNSKYLKVILEEAAATQNAPKGSNLQLIGDFYFAAMDTVGIEKAGITPLSSELAKIDAISKVEDIPAVISHLQYIGVNAMFALGISQDSKKSTEHIVYMYQGGIGLPDRDYYLREDDKSKTLLEQYQTHITKMLQLSGYNEKDASKAGSRIVDIETSFAKKSRTRVELRNREKSYNKKSYAEAKAITPNFNWDNFFKVMDISDLDSVIVGQPEFYVAFDSMLVHYSIEDWKSYLKWHLVHEMSPRLSSKFDDENFDFFGTKLSGLKEKRPRWKRAMSATDRSVGEPLGQLYVKKHFTPESKARVDEMIDNLIASYRERIETRDWMSDATKEQALAKLNAIQRKIGYPDKWKDFSKLNISRESYVKNYINANKFLTEYYVAKLNKPVDRDEWGMTPPTVNAYYSPTMNEIVFPAGIMQHPFFSANADDAVNYGAMGAIIGHELTHGFDDQGSRFNKDGNMENWWTEEDNNNFKGKTEALVKQFDAYTVLDSLHVNGKLTLGENIADLGGLTLSYYAFKKSLEGKPTPEKIDGFTAEQRFFISWAQAWRGHRQPEAERVLIHTNPHSPGQFRANGPLTNMPEFYEAWGVKEGDKMYKPENQRISIW